MCLFDEKVPVGSTISSTLALFIGCLRKKANLEWLIPRAALRGHLRLHRAIEQKSPARFGRANLIRAKSHGTAKVGSVEERTREIGSRQNGSWKLRPSQIGAPQIRIDENRRAELRVIQMGSRQLGRPQVGSLHVPVLEIRAIQMRFAKVGLFEVGANHGGRRQLRSVECRPVYASVHERRAGKRRVG